MARALVPASVAGGSGPASARDGAVLPPCLPRNVTDDEDLRVAGDRQVRPYHDPTRPVRPGAGRVRDHSGEARRLDAGCPQHGPRRQALLYPVDVEPDGPVVDTDDL